MVSGDPTAVRTIQSPVFNLIDSPSIADTVSSCVPFENAPVYGRLPGIGTVKLQIVKGDKVSQSLSKYLTLAGTDGVYYFKPVGKSTSLPCAAET